MKDHPVVRLLKPFSIAVLVGATATVVIGGIAFLLGELVAVVPSGVLTAAIVVATSVLIFDLVGRPRKRKKRKKRKAPGISTIPGVVRYSADAAELADDGDDSATLAPPKKREIPYALQITNLVVGLAVGIAGVIIAVLKI